MVMRAKLLMDKFHAAHKAALAEDNYGAAMSFNSAENFVNNFLHGRQFEETARLTRSALVSSQARNLNDEEVHAGYGEAVRILDEFVAANR